MQKLMLVSKYYSKKALKTKNTTGLDPSNFFSGENGEREPF